MDIIDTNDKTRSMCYVLLYYVNQKNLIKLKDAASFTSLHFPKTLTKTFEKDNISFICWNFSFGFFYDCYDSNILYFSAKW